MTQPDKPKRPLGVMPAQSDHGDVHHIIVCRTNGDSVTVDDLRYVFKQVVGRDLEDREIPFDWFAEEAMRTCTCPRIPLCGFPEGLPPNPHTIRGWSGDCPEHAAEAETNPALWLWAGLPVEPCRCGLADRERREAP